MKILIYADPSCLYDVFLPSIQVMRDHLLRFCGRALLASGKVEIRAVVSEITRWQAGGADELEGIGLIEFSYADLCRIFSGCRSLDAMQLAFFNAQADDSQKRALADWFARRLGTWQPDVVLVFPTQPTLLREIFPQALCLTMENGIFSRFPFPRSLRFEPVDFMNGFPNRYREQIRNFQIGPEEREAVRAFCHRLTELLVGLCPRCAELEALRSRFRHLVLCPVPASNRYEEAAKDDQILWLMEVMEGVPSDIGVLITFHDNVDSQLNERTVAFLRARYPNMVAFDVGRRSLPSAFYFPAELPVLPVRRRDPELRDDDRDARHARLSADYRAGPNLQRLDGGWRRARIASGRPGASRSGPVRDDLLVSDAFHGHGGAVRRC